MANWPGYYLYIYKDFFIDALTIFNINVLNFSTCQH